MVPAESTPNVHAAGAFDDVLKPFFLMMEAELHANAAKGGRAEWLSHSREWLLLEVYHHVAKLAKAARDDVPDSVREHCADVANLTMMLADVCQVLPAPTPSAQGSPQGVTEAEVQVACTHLASVRNEGELRSALIRLRGDIVAELAVRGLVPDVHAAARAKAVRSLQEMWNEVEVLKRKGAPVLDREMLRWSEALSCLEAVTPAGQAFEPQVAVPPFPAGVTLQADVVQKLIAAAWSSSPSMPNDHQRAIGKAQVALSAFLAKAPTQETISS